MVKTLVFFLFFCYNILNIALLNWGEKMSRKKIPVKPGDIILCVLILALSAVMFFTLLDGDDPSRVLISYGDESQVFDLFHDREAEITSQGHTLKIRISDGKVSVTESDCPDKVCMASGEISSSSQVIACVPAGVTIKIEGESDEKIDWIAP